MKKYVLLSLCLILLLALESCGNSGSEDSGNEADMQEFPSFTGLDLDGNSVNSDIFSEHSVTVVNFWFSSCSPCIGELSELDSLDQELKEKGGAVIGINTDTLNGDNSMIEEAKKIQMQQKAATETCILTAIQVTPWILQTASLLSRLHIWWIAAAISSGIQ